jgi:DNA-binding CsgD family transcriptional regulator
MGSQDPDDRPAPRRGAHGHGAGTVATLRRSTAVLPVRGRADDVAVVDGLIAGLQDGRGALLLIEGPPGIGKSRLVREVAVRATRAGVRALSGKAYEDQQTVPFAPLFEALLQARPPIGDPAAVRELSAAVDSRYWVVRDLQKAIWSASSTTPLSISIDDIHWADAGTVMALRALVAELAPAPVMWTFAMRTAGGRPEIRDALSTIAAEQGPAAHHVSLGAVDAEAVAQIAGDMMGASADESLSRLANMSHGNPFLVVELLRGLDEEDRLHVDAGRASVTGRGLPHRLTTTMQRRLDRLSSATRHTVQVASMLPERFSATLLARAVDQGPSRTMANIDEAIRADLLAEDHDQLGFRHDLLRRAAQQTIPYPLRRAMERESAAILLELGAAPEEVATRLARSAEVGDAEAVTALREAARSLGRSDPSGAADLSRRALDLLFPDDGARTHLVSETVVLLNQALRYVEAQQLATASLSSDMPTEEEATIRLTQSIVSRDWPGRNAEQNRRALQLPSVSRETRTRHLAWLAYNLTGDGQTHAARDAAVAALKAVDDHDDLQARTIAECALARVNCVEGHGRRCLDRVSQLQPHPSSPLFGLLGAIVAFDLASLLATMGYLADATDVLGRTFKVSSQIAAAGQVLELVRAQCEFAAGRLSSARKIVESALAEDERLLMNLYGGIGPIILAAVAAHTDDRALLRQVGIAARAALDGGPAPRREALCALAHAAWQRGDAAQAARWLGEDFDLLTTPMWTMDLDYVVLAARVARASSDAGLRQRVLSAVEALEREGRADTLFFAVALHARGLLEDDFDTLTSASQSLTDTARPLLYAGAVEDAGRLMARTGAHDLAVERLSLAFDLYAAHESIADARRVAKSLHGLGLHRRVVRPREETGWDSLTVSELRVLELVADGATNREVALKLTISPHTVNTHLRNVFAKLEIHSRADLIRLTRGS